jgi:hypothetical protein
LKKKILLGCGAVFVLGVILFLAGCYLLLSGPAGGVKMSNEMNEYATKYLSDHKILGADEELVAYYDVTIAMDGSEAAILSTKRIIYHKAPGGDAIDLADIADIKHRKETLIGDVIEIYSQSGKSMKIEIAPLNQGETFLSALELGWENAKVAAEIQ